MFEPKEINERITKVARRLKVAPLDKRTDTGLAMVGKDGESYSMAAIILALAERIADAKPTIKS